MSDPSPQKSKLQLLREAIKAQLVANGWADSAVIIQDQVDVYNKIAVAIGRAANACIVVISVEQGEPIEKTGINEDVTVVVTTFSKALTNPGWIPEEALWEGMVEALTDFIPVYDGGRNHYANRLRYGGFTKAPELALPIKDAAQFARQTLFKALRSLTPRGGATIS